MSRARPRSTQSGSAASCTSNQRAAGACRSQARPSANCSGLGRLKPKSVAGRSAISSCCSRQPTRPSCASAPIVAPTRRISPREDDPSFSSGAATSPYSTHSTVNIATSARCARRRPNHNAPPSPHAPTATSIAATPCATSGSRPSMKRRSKPGSPPSIANPAPSAASANTSTNPSSRRCTPTRRSRPGSSGAIASASIGSAGRMYMSRLPEGMLKNTSTSTTQASGSRYRASRRRRRRRQAGSAQGRASTVGSHAVSATSRKYQAGWPWCQALA